MSRDLEQKKSDYLLELALEEQMETDPELRRYAELAKSQPPHVFSQRHNRRMKKIFRMARKEENKEKYRKRKIRAAAGFIVFFLVAGITVSRVEAFRVPIMRMFTRIKKESTLFGVSDENYIHVTKNYQDYEPTYVLDGFYITEVQEDDYYFYIKYMNDETGQLYFFYYSKTARGFALDTEDTVTDTVEIHGKTFQYSEKNGEIRMYIVDGNVFYLDGKISFEDAVAVMESVSGDVI